MQIVYSPLFKKKFLKLPPKIQTLAKKKIEFFQTDPHNSILRNHQLTGKLKGYSAFSINHSYRILFVYEDLQTFIFIDIGTHSIYK